MRTEWLCRPQYLRLRCSRWCDTDGGAFNVLEGNHALNLEPPIPCAADEALPYSHRDYRDADLTAGFAPSDPAKKEWVAVEANYGNGLLKDMEHRQQYKVERAAHLRSRKHEVTLISIGYYGISHEGIWFR